jgi:adenosylcobinamide-GDP ribazoletransferase
LNDLRAAFSFFTILPTRRQASISEIAASCYLLPLVALALGLAAGLAGWGGEALFGAYVAAAVMLAASLLLTGLHHADGLADFGDALMAHGDASRKVEVLKDRTFGVGALGALFITYLVSWAAMLQLITCGKGLELVWYMIAAELGGRLALLLTALAGPPSHAGSGSEFIAAARGARGVAGIVISLTVLGLLMIPLGWTAPALTACGSMLAALFIIFSGRRWFRGIGGDLLGASVELGGMAALLGLVAALNV